MANMNDDFEQQPHALKIDYEIDNAHAKINMLKVERALLTGTAVILPIIWILLIRWILQMWSVASITPYHTLMYSNFTWLSVISGVVLEIFMIVIIYMCNSNINKYTKKLAQLTKELITLQNLKFVKQKIKTKRSEQKGE